MVKALGMQDPVRICWANPSRRIPISSCGMILAKGVLGRFVRGSPKPFSFPPQDKFPSLDSTLTSGMVRRIEREREREKKRNKTASSNNKNKNNKHINILVCNPCSPHPTARWVDQEGFLPGKCTDVMEKVGFNLSPCEKLNPL